MKNLFMISILFVFFGCKEAIKNEVAQKLKEDEILYEFEEPKVNENLIMTNKEDLLGYWIGVFEGN